MSIKYVSVPMELDRKRFGEDVYHARMDAGLTQDELGELVGMTGKWVSAVELAKPRVLTIRTYELLGNALDLRLGHYWVLSDYSGS